MAIADVFQKIIVYVPFEEASSYRYDIHNGYVLGLRNNGTNPPGPYTDGRSAAIKGYGTEWYDQWTPTAQWLDGNSGICVSGTGWTIDGSLIPACINRSVSVSFWMKPGTKLGDGSSIYNYANLFSFWEGYPPISGSFQAIWLNNGKISWVTKNNAGTNHDLQTSASMNAYRGSYHYFTFTYNVDTGAKRILIDGVEKAAGTGDTNIYYKGTYYGVFSIGGVAGNGNNLSRNPSNYDEFIMLYDYVLDDTDISWFYNGGAGRSYDDIPRNIGSYIKINAGSGSGGYGQKITINNTDNSTGRGKDIEVV